MSTTTISDRRSESSHRSSNTDSSHSPRRENSAQRSTSDPMSPTRTSSSLHSPKMSWHQSYSSFQTSTRAQCPRVHYHPWCDECQTQMEWGQPLPIKPTQQKSMMTFGDLKTAIQERSRYWSLSRNQSASQAAIKKVCSLWRDEQFAKAVAKRSARMAAREAVRQS